MRGTTTAAPAPAAARAAGQNRLTGAAARANMRDVYAVTRRGTVLPGELFSARLEGPEAPAARTAVVAVTGIHGTFYINPFYYNLGDTLTAHGADFLYGQTEDALGQWETVNARTGARELAGSGREDFAHADEDVAAWVDLAAQAGYEHIYLAGHSLGANKVLHYLSATHDARVERFILLSPANVGAMTSVVTDAQKRLIRARRAAGRGQERLPFDLLGWIPANADTAYQWVWANPLDSAHVSPDGDFSDAQGMTHAGALLVGAYDNFCAGDPTGFLENLNAHMPTAAENELVYIKGTGHTYQMREQEMADAVVGLVDKWTGVAGMNFDRNVCR